MRVAKWANRLSGLLPPERPHALRELSLAYAHRGQVKKAWKLAAESCRKATSLKARYEYAKSLLVLGKLGKQLGHPEAAEQIQQALQSIQRIEDAVGARLNSGRSPESMIRNVGPTVDVTRFPQ
jgi:tetratricopeptide (TPR) repeat protein